MFDKKVVCVEDSPTMRRIILNSLNRIGLSNIVEAENGADALEKMGGHDIGLILTDWNMPKMNGEQFVIELKKHEKYKNIPILMITTRGMRDDVMTAVRLGVSGYIIKPFTPDVLRKKLSEVISF